MSRWGRLLLVVLVLLGAAVCLAKQAVAQVITEIPVPTANSYPRGIVTGPDGALWFTDRTPTRSRASRPLERLPNSPLAPLVHCTGG